MYGLLAVGIKKDMVSSAQAVRKDGEWQLWMLTVKHGYHTNENRHVPPQTWLCCFNVLGGNSPKVRTIGSMDVMSCLQQ